MVTVEWWWLRMYSTMVSSAYVDSSAWCDARMRLSYMLRASERVSKCARSNERVDKTGESR